MSLSQYEGVLVKTTNGVALGGVSLPLWLPSLESASTVAAHLVPILSALWLVLQIVRFFSDKARAFRRDDRGGVRGIAVGGLSAVAVAAAAFIGPWEGLSLKAYPDALARNIPTVCYGETRGVALGDTYTKAECDAMLAAAVQEFHGALAKCLPALPKLPKGVQVAFTSWVYNVGPGAGCKSTLVRLANAGDLRGACNQLPRWNRASGMVVRGLDNRRGAERALCVSALPSLP